MCRTGLGDGTLITRKEISSTALSLGKLTPAGAKRTKGMADFFEWTGTHRSNKPWFAYKARHNTESLHIKHTNTDTPQIFLIVSCFICNSVLFSALYYDVMQKVFFAPFLCKLHAILSQYDTLRLRGM